MEPLRFDEVDAAAIGSMSEAELDALPFGMIELAADGTVVKVNRTEGDIVGFHPSAMIGRNFFTDLAPCTNTPDFRGRFDRGIAAGLLRETFEYRYDGQRQASVWVHMLSTGGRYLVLAKRIG